VLSRFVPRHVRFAGARLALLTLLVGALAGPIGSVGSGPSWGGVAAASPAGSSIEPWSQVAGTDGRQYIADQDGRALQFRGMNIKTRNPAVDVSDQVLADAQARGFDLLRLSVFWDLFEPTDDNWNESYLADIGAAMDRAEAHGMWVVLDMHQDGFNPQVGGLGMPDWVTDTDGIPFVPQSSWLLNAVQPATMAAWENFYERPDFRAAQIDAWQELVSRFGDHPALLGYDLLNEPFGKLRDGESFPAAIERVESTQLTPMYQRLTTAIRATDPKHWVFIEPPNQASLGIRTWLGPISGGNVAFFPHLYDSAVEGATYGVGGDYAYHPKFFDTYGGVIDVYPDAHPVPVLFGEWGLAHPEAPGMDRFVRAAMALMDEHGSGWTMFNGCRGEGYCPFDANGEDRPGIGQIVAPFARAIAGSPTSFRYDVGARTLTVVFTDGDATGTTDLVVPAARVYPAGWEVATSDGATTWDWAEQGDGSGTGVISVSTPRTGGAHAVCLRPAGTGGPCPVPVAPPPTTPPTTTTTAPSSPTAPGATPVSGTSSFTG
jgi:endoglycosylceramidase